MESVKTIIEKQIGKNNETTAKELQNLLDSRAQTSMLSRGRFRYTVSVLIAIYHCAFMLPY